MTYSAMNRFTDALTGKPKDRVPIFPMAAAWAAANFTDCPPSQLAWDPHRIVDAQINARESIGYDALWAYSDALFIPEAFGCTVRYLDTGPLADPLPLTITSLKAVDALCLPDPRTAGRLPVIYEVVKGLSLSAKGDLPVLGLIEGPFTITNRIFEPERIMRMLFKNPDVVEALLDKITGFLIDVAHIMIAQGANIIFLPEPMASASMISPAMFRRFVLPRLQTLTDKLSVHSLLHICGDISVTLDAAGESGASILSLDQCMDLSTSRTALPGKVLGGNVDPMILLMGTKQQVANDTLNCLKTAGTHRFILMSGCGVPPKTSLENLITMVQTAKEYGVAQ